MWNKMLPECAARLAADLIRLSTCSITMRHNCDSISLMCQILSRWSTSFLSNFLRTPTVSHYMIWAAQWHHQFGRLWGHQTFAARKSLFRGCMACSMWSHPSWMFMCTEKITLCTVDKGMEVCRQFRGAELGDTFVPYMIGINHITDKNQTKIKLRFIHT